jgi:hypothetical protein
MVLVGLHDAQPCNSEAQHSTQLASTALPAATGSSDIRSEAMLWWAGLVCLSACINQCLALNGGLH